ncbi:MAG: DUF3604 domain-containing protein [Verrucomicrobiales bacterium]|nr:DUF3604 domain-containing protein [Verrucomicrobiales bacterium]MCP5557832.1 DUF3604 domain-containing protein [Verrucomicrobiaceae bacterium]
MKTFTLRSYLIVFCLALSVSSARAEEAGLLILLGAGDSEPTSWDGSLTLSGGKVVELNGWRFMATDKILKGNAWKCSTRNEAIKGRTNNPKKMGKANRLRGPMSDNGIMARLQDVDETTEVSIKTTQGDFSFKLADLPYGKRQEMLDGKVVVQRTAAGRRLSVERTDDDFPAMAVDGKNKVFVTWQSFTPGIDRDERAKRWEAEPEDFSFLATPAGGDQLFLTTRAGSKWDVPLAVTETGRDIYKSAVTPDGQGGAWVIWSERIDRNFEILARHFSDDKLGAVETVSDSKGNDLCPVATTDSGGRVWVSWMGAKDGRFQIFARVLEEEKWGAIRAVSTNTANCWNPAIAADPRQGGGVSIAWDSYEKGDYDIWMREFGAGEMAAPPRPVANSPLYEARVSASYDQAGALWLAWEKSGATWGKDWGAYDGADGIGLYRDRQVGIAVWKDGQWQEPATDIATALPTAKAFSAARFDKGAPPVSPETDDPSASAAYLAPAQRKGQPGKHAEAKSWGVYNNLGRIACAQDGRIWCFVRARQNNSRGPLGSVWVTAATYLDGDKWIGPILVPHSENLLYNLPAIGAGKLGVFVAHSTDHRIDRMADFNAAKQPSGKGGNAALDASKDPFDNDVYFSRLANPATPAPAVALKPAQAPPADNPAPSARTVAERAEFAAIRSFRSDYDGKPLQILRGEFHRHTEISGDGGGDGPLEDMWRYGIDAASMDWLGNGDHDNGNGREYSWWLTQKTTDAFMMPSVFTPMFSYERSVSYPEGHRNVVFVQRGVRTLPRLPISDPRVFAPAPDTTMLYKYLHKFNGVCASHTSVGSMGTDWRNHDPEVEPMVEVYQGARQNYEYPGCPRCPTADDAIGGWEPAGFICNALLKGVKFSFQSSSDHGSTHISYAMVYAEEATREGIHAAMKKRHTYGATDNIIAETRCTAADGKRMMMGDEFTVKGAPSIDITLVGTAPFSRVVIIKDNEEVSITTPNAQEVKFTWTDPKPEAGKTSYYYVRGEQANSELVWASPMWITLQ